MATKACSNTWILNTFRSAGNSPYAVLLTLSLALAVLPWASQAASKPSGLDGDWLGQLPGGKSRVRVQVRMKQGSGGRETCTLDLIEPDAFGIPCFNVDFSGDTLTFLVPEIGASWSGTLSQNGILTGTWSQPGPQGMARNQVDFARETLPIPQAHFTAQDAATLRRMIRSWFMAFSAKDYSAVGRYFAAPYTGIGNRTLILPDLEAVRSIWQRTREVLNGTNYSHTQVLGVRVIPRSATQAVLNVHWRRVNKDGSTFDEGSEFYFASKKSGQWRFDGAMSQNRDLFARTY